MVAEPKVMMVPPDSELARLLDEAAGGDVILVNAGKRFRIVQERGDPFAAYNPEQVRQALDLGFGSLKGLDLETFLEDLREQRGQSRFDLPAER
jgi:hypothetical protein